MIDRYPIAADYAQAAKDIDEFFALAEFRDLDWAHRHYGLPVGIKGSNAVVFQGILAERRLAVRCLTTPPREGALRYEAISEHIASTPGTSLATAAWNDDAVIVADRTFPMVSMEWVEGRELDEYVEAHLHDRATLESLVDDWITLVVRLSEQGAAHGDLQHGNVLVAEDGTLRLVDLDGVWLPEIASHPSAERGHPNYQHPGRAVEHWGANMDSFAALAIEVSIRALVADPTLWERYNDSGTNLLFTRADYEAIIAGEVGDRGVVAEVRELAGTIDGDLAAAWSGLEEACRFGPDELAGPVDALRHRQIRRQGQLNVWPPKSPSNNRPRLDRPASTTPRTASARRTDWRVIAAAAGPLLIGIIIAIVIFVVRS